MLTFDEPSHRYFWNGAPVPGVTGILAPLSDFGMVSREIMDAASAFGTAVHLACELDDLGTLDRQDLDPALNPYLEAWDAFSRDWAVEWEGIEEKVYHPQLRYAGTLDRRGTLASPRPEDAAGGFQVRRAAIVDIKTSTSLYPAVGPQLAAYARALEHSVPGASPSPMRLAVQLKADGTYHAQEYRDPQDFAVFSSLLTLRNWCARHQVAPRF